MGTRHGFRLGTICGIPIQIHYTFLLVLPFFAYLFGQRFIEAARLAHVPAAQLTGSPWMWGLLVAIALFVAVLVHELAHSLYALSHGGKVRSITLLMIGGVSELSGEPRPGTEAVMALVGPLASVVIGVVCFALYRLSAGLRQFDLSFALFYLAQLNLILGVFNLLPAFPMDGGRILRGVLAGRRGPVRATQIAAAVGKVFAIGFGVWGFLSGNFLLILVAFFVFIGAEGEQHAVLARAVLGDLRVHELMVPYSRAAAVDESLYEVAEWMIRDRRLFLPAMDGGRVVGTITLDAIERVPVDARRATPAGAVLVSAAIVGVGDKIADALRVFAELRTPGLAVADGDRLVGTLSQVDVMRGLRIRELAASQHPDPRVPLGEAGARRA